jgi:hypothetical protein
MRASSDPEDPSDCWSSWTAAGTRYRRLSGGEKRWLALAPGPAELLC